jgi:hypothetical protein
MPAQCWLRKRHCGNLPPGPENNRSTNPNQKDAVMTVNPIRSLLAAVAASALLAGPAMAAHHEGGEEAMEKPPVGGMRAELLRLQAEVTAVDVEAGNLQVRGPLGNVSTLRVPPDVADITKISVGDLITAEYIAALAGELREPTEEELANPLVVLEQDMVSEDLEKPAVGGARVIRAVCTIEGMNRLTNTVVIQGPNGGVHVLTDVDPAKMEGVTLGETVVMEYTEAIAVGLQRLPASE